MAIVSLGTLDLSIGQGFYQYQPFAYRDRDAYIIYADFSTPNFSSIFSFIRIIPYIEPSGGTPRLLATYIDLEVLNVPQMFYFPTSRLFNGNGNCTFYVERISRYTGGGEGQTVNLSLSYDDNLTVNTWL